MDKELVYNKVSGEITIHALHLVKPYWTLSIDPVNRIIYVGNSDMFGSATLGQFALDTDNGRFIRNVLAFMVNADQYGDTFLDDFR